MEEKTLSRLAENKIIPAVISLICVYFLLPTFFEFSIFPVESSGTSWKTLDPSWQLTLNKVNLDHLEWGKDFTFTYGPLSYLSTRVGWHVNKVHFLLYDLFLAFNFFCVFYFSYRKSAQKIVGVLLILAATLALPAYFGSGNSVVLLAFLVFWLRLSLEKSKPFYYVMQILLATLIFFIKFNTGLISFMLLIAGLAYQTFFAEKRKWVFSIYLLATVLLISVLCRLLNVSFIDYVRGGMNMVDGYNDVMYQNQDFAAELYAALAVTALSLLVLVSVVLMQKTDWVVRLFVLGLFSGCLYILNKQAFVRGDIQHISEFYQYVLLIVVCFPEFHFANSGIWRGSLITAIATLTLYFAAKTNAERFAKSGERFSKATYLQQFGEFNDSSGFHLFPNNNQVPQRIKERVAQNYCDVYPWNSHMLFENKLKYRPRPVFQSYTAYTPYLEELNFNFYQSDKAPAYVFYEWDAIDGRYPLFDESKLNLLLLKGYNCVDTFRIGRGPILLLEKKPARQHLMFEKVDEYTIELGDDLVPQKGMYYELLVSNSIKGKIVSIFKYAPELTLVIKTKDGNQSEYRTSKKLLETGIFGDRLLNTTMDFYHYLKNDSAGAGALVKSYNLKPSKESFFNKSVRVREYKIKS